MRYLEPRASGVDVSVWYYIRTLDPDKTITG